MIDLPNPFETPALSLSRKKIIGKKYIKVWNLAIDFFLLASNFEIEV